jgi:transposase
VAEISTTLFDVPVALGTVVNGEQEVSQALAEPHAEAVAAVRAAATKNVDETGWKRAGKLCWLWAAATATVAAVGIHARRSAVGLAALLGETIQGIISSDRWSAYQHLPARFRPLCWAHLNRDFQKCGPGRCGAGPGSGGTGGRGRVVRALVHVPRRRRESAAIAAALATRGEALAHVAGGGAGVRRR